MKCYGYVGNVVDQIEKILQAAEDVVHRKVFYVGDRPMKLIDWANGFSVALTGRNVRIVPRSVLRGMAVAGDVLSMIGVNFPIYTSRFHSMTEDYLIPMEPTLRVFGDPPYSLENGIRETVSWLKREGYA